jgi:hypothetical protein
VCGTQSQELSATVRVPSMLLFARGARTTEQQSDQAHPIPHPTAAPRGSATTSRANTMKRLAAL